ncbi:hypothetical protein F383_01537 [Gossypium arboreum]|uniref:Uncharacterized protein n=1 Tax=Gossypium arboreum TaxID=29729 RepID=A0A0B0NG71_GOSAR|nr:hypothetical protein F383_01537 [Gossypium arboreum]
MPVCLSRGETGHTY